jgi:hypothetical protein
MNLHRAKHSTSNAQRSTPKCRPAAGGTALGVECLKLSVERFRPGAGPVLSSTRRQVANPSYFGEVA